ncbi:MAG: PLDc N-terminal domain-containing protein [Bacteroidota bacterium]|nr:PLDc N-terminal domain-containing protein [Bacteroidota bacterium]
MLFFNHYYYYLIIGLQAICVIHCIRKGRSANWIWLIVFLPLIGCLIYLFTEIFTGRDIQNVQSGMISVFNPGGSVRRLEENLRFSDTFANRIALADAYLATGNTDRAIELYESSLTGNFVENEHVLSQLIIAYYQKKRYRDIIPIAKKIYNLPQFPRSRPHILYAAALGYTGNYELAEKEFKTMKARFANYEARYYYALFLSETSRVMEARRLFSEMLDEVTHLSSREKRYNRNWLRLAKEELSKLNHTAA